MTTKPIAERRIAKKVVAVKKTGQPSAPPVKEVRKSNKPVPTPVAADPVAPVVTEVRKADDEHTESADQPAKVKRTKAEARAIRDHNKVTPTPKDAQRLEGNLTLLDEIGPDIIGQLIDYFGAPFADGGPFDPTLPGVLNKRVVMWTVPYRRKMEGTGVDGADGKFLKFQRYELSLLGDVIHEGETYVVLYPLDGVIAAAVPLKEWHKLPTPIPVPTDDADFDEFLRNWAQTLKNIGGVDLTTAD